DLNMFSMLRSKMHWHQTRQRVLAENVANADTPSYRARDLAAFSTKPGLKLAAPQGLSTSITHSTHLKAQERIVEDVFNSKKVDGFEITPEGNAVVLEEQMMKVTANQMDYQAVSTLYSKGMGLIKTAIRRR
ncbi:MAG: flagellar basal body rod protein FlgB, partial [Cohaesibacter sp.]|nr:flagellar basal body rod protein FlgB [Cohaesibacter sp.]